MKHAKLFFLAVCTLGVNFSGYADLAECNTDFGPAVHCAYTSGTDDGFILIKAIKNKQVEVDCLPSNFADTIEQDDASSQNLGQNFWSYAECTNQDCSSTLPMVTDSFILTFDNGIYKAFPANFSFNVDISKGVHCLPPCPGCTHKFIKIK